MPPPALPEAVDPKSLADDPDALVRFVEARPERLDVGSMDPALAMTLAQVLLRGNRTFLAEKLLYDATRRWPDRVDLARAWARVLISLGRPTPAREALTALREAAPGDPVLRYLLARALLAEESRTMALTRAAVQELEAVLEIDPQYADPDGVTAADVKLVLARLKGGGREDGPDGP